MSPKPKPRPKCNPIAIPREDDERVLTILDLRAGGMGNAAIGRRVGMTGNAVGTIIWRTREADVAESCTLFEGDAPGSVERRAAVCKAY